MDSTWPKKTADAFWLAAARSLEQRRTSPNELQMLLIPGVVCLALSIELGFKAILVKARKPPKTHDLKRLFEALPQAVQQEIIIKCNCLQASFDQALSNVAKSFEEWRYVYELENPQIDLPFLSLLADAVQLVTDALAL